MGNSKDLSFAFITDLHHGNPRLDPDRFYQKLQRYLYPVLPKIQILFIGGDFWDTLIHMSTRASVIGVMIIQDLEAFSAEYGFLIRVVRGTYIHDRDQCNHFLTLNTHNVKLFDTIDIETIETEKIQHLTVLYMPDDLPGDHLEEAVSRMKQLQLNSVDLIVHHGYFKHLIRHGIPILPPHTLTIDEVSKKLHPKLVLNGHVHKPGVYKNVISGGSFDRLAHGEEEAKGFFVIHTDQKLSVISSEFIENKDATLFLTADLEKYPNMEEALTYYKSWFEEAKKKQTTLTGPLQIRLLTASSLISEVLEDWTKKQDRSIIITKECMNEKKEQIVDNVNTTTEELPKITKQNVGELMMELIQKKYPHITLERVNEILGSLNKE